MSPSVMAHRKTGELHFICIFSICLSFSGKNAVEVYKAIAVLLFCLLYLPSIKGLVILTGSYLS